MKIAIAGYGTEGKSNYQYFSSRNNAVTIVDERESLEDAPQGASCILGPGAFGNLEGFDLVVRTAGLNPHKIQTNGKIWSATNEFFEQCPAPVIGVTGSKGKGTTASIIASILSQAGKRVHLLGNIGVPALDILDKITAEDIVVYELSSFQLWDVERSPHVGVVLMIEPEHLDVHKDMEEYVGAKAHIAMYQREGDVLIYNAANQYSSQIAQRSSGTKIGYQDISSAHVNDGAFYYGEQRLCALETLRLPGEHNQDNVCAAINAAWFYTTDAVSIENGIAAFDGLPHRLKFVRKLSGVSFYDDSIATTPGSAIAAINAFDEWKILIIGGSYKGADFQALAEHINSSNVRHVILIGQEAERIQAALNEANYRSYTNLGSDVSMEQIVREAYRHGQDGDVIVLSPSCASFGMFKNYSDRGDKYIRAVLSLDENASHQNIPERTRT